MQECCVCFEETKFHTVCNHPLCLRCLCKIPTPYCPMCRRECTQVIKSGQSESQKRLVKFYFKKRFIRKLVWCLIKKHTYNSNRKYNFYRFESAGILVLQDDIAFYFKKRIIHEDDVWKMNRLQLQILRDFLHRKITYRVIFFGHKICNFLRTLNRLLLSRR
jgi:hypothetical protein